MEKEKRRSCVKIEEALLTCLKEKPLEKVTVREVCAAADVNRSTFYANYRDLEDVLYELQMEYFMRIYREVLEELPEGRGRIGMSREQMLTIMRKAVHYHAVNKEYLMLLSQNNADGAFETNIALGVRKEFMPPGYSRLEEYEFIYHFIGSLTAILCWLTDGQPCSEEEFARFLAGFGPEEGRG